MSIQTDQFVKELQTKVAWLEKEVAELKAAKTSVPATGPAKPAPLGLGKGKPS